MTNNGAIARIRKDRYNYPSFTVMVNLSGYLFSGQPYELLEQNDQIFEVIK